MYRVYRNGHLEYYHRKRTDESFWEQHWEQHDAEGELRDENEFLEATLCRINAPGAHILEAGCGLGGFLYSMRHYGYYAVGLDFARHTLHRVKQLAPELNLIVGDLKKLPILDGVLDAYWSIGVIKHFKDGYGGLLNECRRVLKKGGTAYISFPYMNWLRKLKGGAGGYEREEPTAIYEFYQYALEHRGVRRTWERAGFEYLGEAYMFPHARLAGIRNKILKFLLDPWHHHSIMLIFKRL